MDKWLAHSEALTINCDTDKPAHDPLHFAYSRVFQLGMAVRADDKHILRMLPFVGFKMMDLDAAILQPPRARLRVLPCFE